MKNKIFIVAAFFSLVFVACKGDKADTEANTPVQPAGKENFSVELDVVAPVKDDFCVYYTEDGTNNFQPDKAAWSGVVGQPTSQKVVFDLPAEVVPTHIRVDFGINKDQGDVILEKFKMSYYDKSFEMKGSDFLKYFLPNDSVKTEIDEVKGTIKFLKNPKKHFTPFYYPNQITPQVKAITQ